MFLDVRKKYFLLLVLIDLLVFLYHLGGRDLWEPDETRYAMIAIEMRQTGNWIMPTLDGQLYTEKPPLYFWLINSFTFFLGHHSEFANRLPSALAGFFVVLVTFSFALRLMTPWAAFVSALILSTCFLFPQVSRWMMLDSLFSLFFLLALFFFHRGLDQEERQRKYFLWAGVSMGLGILVKGPIAYLPVPILLVYALLAGDLRKAWNLNLLWGVLLSFAVVLAWFVPALGTVGEKYLSTIFSRQIAGRFVLGVEHPEPVYFYFVRLPLGFMPWSLFWGGTFAYTFRQIRKERSKTFLFLAVWCVFAFVFFTFSRAKKDNYLLPIYPALAMLGGAWWSSAMGVLKGKGRQEGWFWAPLAVLSGVSLAGWIMIQLGTLPRVSNRLLEDILPYLHLAGWPFLFVALGGVLGLVLSLKNHAGSCVMALAIGLIFAHLYSFATVPAVLDERVSAKPFSEEVLRHVGKDPLKIWKFQSTGLLFYTERPIEKIYTLDGFFRLVSGPASVFVVFDKNDFRKLQEKVDLPLVEVSSGRSRHRTLLLVSSRPPQ